MRIRWYFKKYPGTDLQRACGIELLRLDVVVLMEMSESGLQSPLTYYDR